MDGEITAVLPALDPVITDYSVGFLTHAATSTSPEADLELAEAISSVTQILLDAAPPSLDQERVRSLVSKLVSQLEAKHGDRRETSSQARRLDQAINVASHKSISATMGLLGGGVDIDAVGTRKIESKVDKKKLEKAERKIKAKQDKKIMKNVTYEASKLVDGDDQRAYEEFYMTVNPLNLDSASAGKSKDIKVEGMDVSIGGQRILTDTTLTLAYGRRYGLVGKNGIGKSTLLRALSRREVAIPTHITILHVEQEVGTLRACSWNGA